MFLSGRIQCTFLKEKEFSCEGPLTETEFLSLTSFKQMADSKTPGTSGLPAEFFKMFWCDISDAFIAALNFAYEIQLLREEN